MKMNKYNDEYYIVFENYNNETLYLSPLQKTFDRNYTYTKINMGQEPLFFENAYKDKDLLNSIQRPIKNAHLNLNYPIVSNKIKDDINNFEIDNFQLYPTVIIDDNGDFYDNFWFFNIYNKIDALNLEHCIIDDYDEDDKRHDIDKYYLDVNKLNSIQEEKRLIFIPEKASGAPVFVHKKIVDIFNKHKVDTLKFIKVSEWEMGKQF
ncbi:imm11 family protein [Aliivibrio fischeri]|uniref:imm11 family protein n=2 Tax=Aliivibrio fischeri TaxID=668 RepID=UPI0037361DD4